jgi:hypothetical protein
MIGEDLEKMDGVLKRKFRVSLPNDSCVIKLQEYCKFSNILLKIPVVSKPLCVDANCHNNVSHYVSTYGGEKISGYYLITDVDNDNYGCAIYHSIWKNTYGELVDITPFEDNREYNIFSILSSNDYYSGVLCDGEDFKILSPGMNIL